MGAPNILVPAVLLLFGSAVAIGFVAFDGRRAVLWSLIGGWLFLPYFDGRYEVLKIGGKAMFVAAAVLVGSIVFDARRWRQLRLHLLDLPMIMMCAVPFLSAIANDLGVKEAASATWEATLTWAAPYALGRVYFGSPRGAREFAVALVTAALVYVPFCLWENRMSPQLHSMLYGFRPFSFDQVYRFGGYRPSVFMQHGLALGMFMTLGTVSAFWLWRTRTVNTVAAVPMSWAFAALCITTILCKSTGAIILLAVGIGVLEGTLHLRRATLVLVLALLPAVYCTARLSGWDADTLVELTQERLGEDRAGSIAFRIENEHLLLRKAMMKPWLGWGRFGRSFVYNEQGDRLTTTDSLWIIVLGLSGLVGLVSIGMALALPPLELIRTFRVAMWPHPVLAPIAVLALALLLWAIDDLLNAMLAPVFPAIAGAIVSFVRLDSAHRRRRRDAGSHGLSYASASRK